MTTLTNPATSSASAAEAVPINQPVARFWEIDALRGVAIVMMVIYHLMWDLLFFGVLTNIALQAGFWKLFQRTTASTFIFLVGVSLVVSYNRASAGRAGGGAFFAKFFWRGLRVFGWGMVLTLLVRMAGVGRIDFGVLHLIGLSIVAAYPFLRFGWLNVGLWLAFNGVGFFLQPPLVEFPWLVWLGFKPPAYSYLDYFPVVPWFGLVLLGIGVGNLLYAGNQRRYDLPDLAGWWLIRPLRAWGRNSLAIYLLHQPLLFVLLYGALLLLGRVDFGL